MPDFSDPVEAAQQRARYMLDLRRPRKDSIRQAAEIGLKELDKQQDLSQRQQTLAERQQEFGQRMQQHSIEFEANQRRQMAHDAATESTKRLTLDRETEIDEQGAAMLHTMGQLDASLRRGQITKDQYDDGLLAAGQQYPLAMRHPEAAKHYNFAIEEADKQNNFRERQEFREASRLGAKYGIGVQADPDTGLPSIEHTRQTAMQTDKGRLERLHDLNAQMLGRYGLGVSSVFEHAAGGRLENPQDPKTFKQTDPNDKENPQTHVQMSVLNPNGKAQNVVIEKPRFDQIKSEFEPAYKDIVPQKEVQPAGAEPSTTPTNAAPAGQTVRMRSPDGMEQDVPADHAAHYQSLGATPVTQ